MVVDIGGGTTEVGVISLGGMVYKGSVRVGGDKFDEADHQLHPPQLRHADRRADRRRRSRRTSARPSPAPRSRRWRSRAATSPKACRAASRSRSNEILEALTDPLNQIVSSVKNALEQTPPELGADIAERGMMLTGGGALLRDLDRLLAEETGLPVLVAEDPLTCVVRGCGMALERMERLGSHLHLRVSQHAVATPARAARWPARSPPADSRAMPLGTLDRTPPPFFRQGPSALTKLVFFSALALFLMVADTRFKSTQPMRAGARHRAAAGAARAAGAGASLVAAAATTCVGLQRALAGEDAARAPSWRAQAERATRAEQLRSENTRLRALLELRPALQRARRRPPRCCTRRADPYSRKVVHRPRRRRTASRSARR